MDGKGSVFEEGGGQGSPKPAALAITAAGLVPNRTGASFVLGAAYVRTFVTLSGSPAQGLRLVVHRAGDPSATTYCVPVTNIERIPFTSFNTKCWDGSGIALRPEDVPNIDRIALHVPATSSPVAVDNLCLSGLYLQ